MIERIIGALNSCRIVNGGLYLTDEADLTPSQKPSLKMFVYGAVIVGVIAIIGWVLASAYLGRGELYVVDLVWNDNHPLFSSPYAHVEGSIFNSGERTASNVVLVLRLYSSGDTLLKTESLDIGYIGAKQYRSFSIDIYYSGDAARCSWQLSYKS